MEQQLIPNPRLDQLAVPAFGICRALKPTWTVGGLPGARRSRASGWGGSAGARSEMVPFPPLAGARPPWRRGCCGPWPIPCWRAKRIRTAPICWVCATPLQR
jgi:hypothetical protein